MNLIKSTTTFSFFTLISRIFGYARDLLLAIYLGSGPVADAFFVAFRIPNTFRRLFSEGTFNAAFVPSYSSELATGKKNSQNFANKIFNILLVSLLAVVLIIEIYMPGFIFIIAFRGPDQPGPSRFSELWRATLQIYALTHSHSHSVPLSAVSIIHHTTRRMAHGS